MNVGERIKYLRKVVLGLTAEKFGAKLGIQKSAVSKIERGENDLSKALSLSICREFGVSEEWLRTGWGDPFVEKSREDQILSYFEPLKDLNDEFKSRFAKALAALDEKDWEIIDELVDRLKRKSAEEREKEQEDSGLMLQAAHKRTDIEIPEGVDTSDDEYFD